MLYPFTFVNHHTVFTGGLKREPVVLDLGANHGGFSRRMREMFGGDYYLVEANPTLGEKLTEESWTSVFRYAVGAQNGSVRFNVALNHEGSSLLTLPEDSPYGCTRQNSVEIEARTLESILTEIGQSRIDILKVDVEGAEIAVFDALPSSVLDRIGQMTVEFHGDAVFGFGQREDVERTLRHLGRQGFVCLDFSHRIGEHRRDVLCVNRSIHGVSCARALYWKVTTYVISQTRRALEHVRLNFRPIRERLPRGWQNFLLRLRHYSSAQR